MTKVISKVFILFWITIFLFGTAAHAKRYGASLCDEPGYTCIKIKRGQSWKKLWPNPQMRRIVMRVNRRNLRLYAGLVIAVPNNLYEITHLDVAPLPYFITSHGRSVIVLDMKKQAFGAYDSNGYLVHWGPISGGKGWCRDLGGACTTPRGNFYVFRKGDAYCKSTRFPIPHGGAPMNYCMYFLKGFAMHAGALPGNHASHGCVRMFYEDAEWLNEKFINMGRKGTRVIVR